MLSTSEWRRHSGYAKKGLEFGFSGDNYIRNVVSRMAGGRTISDNARVIYGLPFTAMAPRLQCLK